MTQGTSSRCIPCACPRSFAPTYQPEQRCAPRFPLCTHTRAGIVVVDQKILLPSQLQRHAGCHGTQAVGCNRCLERWVLSRRRVPISGRSGFVRRFRTHDRFGSQTHRSGAIQPKAGASAAERPPCFISSICWPPMYICRLAQRSSLCLVAPAIALARMLRSVRPDAWALHTRAQLSSSVAVRLVSDWMAQLHAPRRGRL